MKERPLFKTSQSGIKQTCEELDFCARHNLSFEAARELRALVGNAELTKLKSDVERLRTIKDNPNFQYCIHFLKNAGERIRAIRIVMDVAGMSFSDAREYVDAKWSSARALEETK